MATSNFISVGNRISKLATTWHSTILLDLLIPMCVLRNFKAAIVHLSLLLLCFVYGQLCYSDPIQISDKLVTSSELDRAVPPPKASLQLSLKFSNCRFDADALSKVSLRSDLHSLQFSLCDLREETLDQIGELPKLDYLSFESSTLPKNSLEAITRIKELEGLDLVDMTIKGRFLGDWQNTLKDLSISSSTFDFSALEPMRNFSVLNNLVVIATNPEPNPDVLGRTMPSQLQGVLQVQNSIKKETDKWLKLAATKLRKPAYLNALGSQWNTLVYDLSHSDLTDDGMTVFAKSEGFKMIESINLSQTSLTSKGVSFLDFLPNLKIVDLSQTKIDGECISNQEWCRRIGKLTLQSNALSSRAFEKLLCLPNLSSLDVSKSHLSCPKLGSKINVNLSTLTMDDCKLPKDLSFLKAAKNLQRLSLQGVKLNSLMIIQIAKCHSLRNLDLSFCTGLADREVLLPLCELPELSELLIKESDFPKDDLPWLKKKLSKNCTLEDH